MALEGERFVLGVCPFHSLSYFLVPLQLQCYPSLDMREHFVFLVVYSVLLFFGKHPVVSFVNISISVNKLIPVSYTHLTLPTKA